MRTYLFLPVAMMVSLSVYAQQFQWAKQIGSGDYESGSDITTDADGNSYTTGSFRGTVDFDPGTDVLNKTAVGGSDIFVLKLDSDGNLVWVQTFGGINDEGVASIELDASGNVYTTGNFQGGGDFDPGPGVFVLSGWHDVFITKLDTSGGFVWAKSIGGGYFDFGNDLAVDQLGNVYVTGHFEGGGDFDPGKDEFSLYTAGGFGMYVLKLDTDGNFQWAKMLNGNSNTLAEGSSITVDGNGNTYSIGRFSVTADFDPGDGVYDLQSKGGFDAFILKLDTDGEFVWARQVGGPGNDYGTVIALDKDNNIYLAGTFEETCDFDPATGTNELTSNGLADVFISKLDIDGDLTWVRSLGGNENESVNSIALDPVGNIYTSGLFKGKADFDPGASVLNLVATGDSEPDVFFLELSVGGSFISCQRMGRSGTEEMKVTVDGDGVIYAAGFFSGIIDLGAGIGEMRTNGVYDILLLKMNALITDTEDSAETPIIEVFPNPSSDYIKVSSGYLPHDAPCLLFITDPFGKEVLREVIEHDSVINIRNLKPGLYFVRTGELNGRTSKLLKQ